jgi:class 3 adenylate cyclase
MARILIVDDQPENREALRLVIGDENPDWQVLVAADDAEAIAVLERQKAQREPIDVVLTDLVMRDEQSGMNLLQTARRIDPQIMSILFTAQENNLDRYAALDFGAFDVVEKNIRGARAAHEILVKMRAALRYREWSQQIGFLRRYFDRRVFEVIESDRSVLEMRQRTVTIVFWDIRGFSTLCEVLKASPTLVAGFLREHGDTAARAIFEHGGILDKFIGDGVMALFGVLSRTDDHGRSDAIAAVRAALALREQFTALANRWVEQWSLHAPQKIEIALACGVHTGEALVGNVGTEFREQFTALGQTVNIASRIASRAQGGQILVSQSTEGRIREVLALAPAGEVADIKNVPGTLALFAVEGEAQRNGACAGGANP